MIEAYTKKDKDVTSELIYEIINSSVKKCTKKHIDDFIHRNKKCMSDYERALWNMFSKDEELLSKTYLTDSLSYKNIVITVDKKTTIIINNSDDEKLVGIMNMKDKMERIKFLGFKKIFIKLRNYQYYSNADELYPLAERIYQKTKLPFDSMLCEISNASDVQFFLCEEDGRLEIEAFNKKGIWVKEPLTDSFLINNNISFNLNRFNNLLKKYDMKPIYE